MKKLTVITLIAFAIMIAILPVSAAKEEFSISTLGGIFDWDMTMEEVNLVLDKVEGLSCVLDEEYEQLQFIDCELTKEDGEESWFSFAFVKGENPTLFEFSGDDFLPEKSDYKSQLSAISKRIGILEKEENYEGEYVDSIIEDAEDYFAVADNSTILILAGCSETDDSLAWITVTYGHRPTIEAIFAE